MAAASTNKILASAAKSASYNMVLQIMFRMMTFVLNAFILRYISKEMLGVVNVRLTLLYSTVLFMSREAFRRACLSQTSRQHWQQVINLLWCTFPLGIIFGAILGYVWIAFLEQPDPNTVPNYSVAVVVFAFTAILELLSEPMWVLGQAMLFVKLKVIVEGLAIAGRCLLTVVLVLSAPHLGITTFCLAQIFYSIIYISLYYVYFMWYVTNVAKKNDDFPIRSIRDFFPRPIQGQAWTSAELTKLTWSFFKQGFLKQLLTEGERYVMTFFDVLSFGDQGIYDVINNLGSLAARFIFLPIEESGYLFFAQTLKRGVPVMDQPKDSIQLASQVLECLLKIVVLIGLTILAFGYAYSFLLLDLYAGSLLSSGSGPTLLRWYCVYVLLIAVNGTTECFVFAAMSQKEVDRYNHKMFAFSLIFLSSSWYLTKTIGSVGFILANCFNMSARITHSIYFILIYYKESSFQPLKGLLPSIPVLLVFGASWVITSISEVQFCCDKGLLYQVVHVAVGAVCLLVVAACILLFERDLLSFIKEQWRIRRGGGTDRTKDD